MKFSSDWRGLLAVCLFCLALGVGFRSLAAETWMEEAAVEIPPSEISATFLDSASSAWNAKSAAFKVEFSGARKVSRSLLKRIVRRPEFRDYSPYLIDDLADAVQDFYRSRGYADAMVRGIDEPGEPTRRLRIEIEEGTQYRVRSARIEGNTVYPDTEIIALLRLRPERFQRAFFDRSVLRDDRRRIADFYLTRGYLEVEVSGEERIDRESGAVYLRHRISEGPRYSLAELSFSGNVVYSTDELHAASWLREGEAYSPIETRAARARILDFYRNRGYLNCEVELRQERDFARREVRVQFLIAENRQVFVREIHIEGNRRTRSKVIWREVELKPGEPMSRARMSETRKNLFATGLFSSVRVEPSHPAIGSASGDVTIEVEETRYGRIRPGVGYGTLQGPLVSLDASYSNLFGLAHEAGFWGEWTGTGDWEELYYRIRNIFRSKFDFRGRFFRSLFEEPSFDIYRLGAGLELRKRLGRHWNLLLQYSLEDIDLAHVAIDPSLIRLSENEGTLSRTGAVLVHDTRDNSLDPHRGRLSRAAVAVSSQYLGSEFDFVKAELSTAWFIPVTRKSTFALSVRGGLIEPFGQSSRSPLSERFFVGGDDTIRGFARDKVGVRNANGDYVGGDALFLFNAEYRVPLYRELTGAVFYDAGNAWESGAEIDLGDLREGAGVGLRYVSPAAAIRLDYGRVLDRREGEDPWRLHFSIGHAF